MSQRKVPPYHIPLRALVARDADNLWMAGRDLSADMLAMASARVASSGAMMGQAVGVAAAIAARNDCPARDVDADEVKQILIARDANLSLAGRPTSIM